MNVRGRADYLELGDYNAVCSMCGRKRKASTMVRNWQGLYRCPEHNEARHPQDFVRAVKDVQTVPWSQPPADITIYVCDFNGLSAVPGWAMPGCMIPGRAVLLEGMGSDPPPEEAPFGGIITDLGLTIRTDTDETIEVSP